MNVVLDQRTLILLVSVFYLVLPPAVWLVLGRPRTRGPVLWCGGSLLGGVGFALMGMRGAIPDALSYLVGQPLLILGALMATQSLRSDLARPWPWSALLGAVLGYAAVLAYLLDNAQAPTLGALIRAANLTVMLGLVHAAWAVSRAERSRNALTIALAYGAQILGIVVNLASSWRGSSDIHTLQGSVANQVAYLIMILVGLVGSMAYLGLALERSHASAFGLAQEASRREQWRKRRQAMAQADRTHLLVLLTESLSQALLQPLTGASLNLQLAQRELRKQPQGSAQARQWLSEVIAGILSANATIERIRALVKPAPRHPETVDLARVLQDVQQLVRAQTMSQKTLLQLDPVPQDTTLRGDRIALTHALLQLLHNALTAVNTQALREVRLSVWQDGHQVGIRVSDSGPGFTDATLQAMKSRFQPAQASLQGTGLQVVRSIVKQHGGQMSLSNPPTGGACVSLLFAQDR